MSRDCLSSEAQACESNLAAPSQPLTLESMPLRRPVGRERMPKIALVPAALLHTQCAKVGGEGGGQSSVRQSTPNLVRVHRR
jgi:hypothetical protein